MMDVECILWHFSSKCTGLPVFYRQPAAMAVPSPMGDIKYKTIGFIRRNIIWRQNALRPLGWRSGETRASSLNHVFNMFTTLFDLFDPDLT